MDLIECIYMSKQNMQTNLFCTLSQKYTGLISLNHDKIHIFYTSLKKYMQIINKITIKKQYQIITSKSYFITNHLLICKDKIHLGLIIRSFLKLNSQSKYKYLKIHPLSGQIYFEISLNNINCIDYLKSTYYEELFQIILNSFQVEQFDKTDESLIDILQIISNQEKNKQNYSKEDYLLSIKKYILASSQYSWNILAFNSTVVQCQDHKYSYQTTKDNYLKNQNKPVTIHLTQVLLRQILACKYTKTYQKSYLSQKEDQELKNRYLNRNLVINHHQNQVNQITISKQAFQFLCRAKSAKIVCHQYGPIKVSIQLFDAKFRQNLQYQKRIIQSLPKKEFIGIPKFYFLKNLKQQSQLSIITNLTFTKDWSNYLNSNSQCISIFTLLNLQYQKAVILRYLKDANIIFHNLVPSNIKIKKGLCVNIVNFSNAFKYEISIKNDNKQEFKVKNIFPYVANNVEQNQYCIGDQRSDSYSFGVNLYQTLTKKTPHNIRDSMKISYNENKYIKKLENNPLISIEKMNYLGLDILKILMSFCLMTIYSEKNNHLNVHQNSDIQHKFILKKLRQTDSLNKCKNNGLSQRPYLDWVTIIIKNILEAMYILV